MSTRAYANTIIDQIQNLEEMGGPESIEQYVAVLALVKQELDYRVDNALKQLECDGRFCVHKLCPSKGIKS